MLCPADVFFCISLILMVASLLETVHITNIQFRASQYSAVPHWLSVLVLQYLAVLVFIPPMKRSNTVTVFFNPATRGILILSIQFIYLYLYIIYINYAEQVMKTLIRQLEEVVLTKQHSVEVEQNCCPLSDDISSIRLLQSTLSK